MTPKVSYNVSSKIPNFMQGSPAVVLNQAVRGLDMSPTVGINELSNRLRKEGRNVYKLGLGQSPFPVPQFMVNRLQEFAREKDYLPSRGLYALREAIAQFGVEYCKLPTCSAEHVIVGPGSKELMFNLQLCYYGTLVMARGSWVSYQPQAQLVNRNYEWIETAFEKKYKLTPDDLVGAFSSDPFKPRILLLNYPSNPTGQSYTADELEALANVCRQFQVLVLSDEIYAPLQFDGQEPHASIAQFYPEGTIISTGVSKWAGAGGWRCGAFIFPEQAQWLQDAMSAVASETFTSVSAPIQYACIPAFSEFSGSEMQNYLRIKNRTLTGLGSYATNALKKCGADVHIPEGGFYIFPDFKRSPKLSALEARWRERHDTPKGVKFNNEHLSTFILEETGVAQLCGKHFGIPDSFNLRLAFVDFDGSDILQDEENLPESGSEMEPFLRKHCPNTLNAFDSLTNYFDSL